MQMWATTKRSLRAVLTGGIASLRSNLDIELGKVQFLWVAKWFRHCRNYVVGYQKFADDPMRVFKYVKNQSHRRAPVKNNLIDTTRLADGELSPEFFDELRWDESDICSNDKEPLSEQSVLEEGWNNGIRTPVHGISDADLELMCEDLQDNFNCTFE